MFPPGFTIIRSQNNNLTFLLAQRSKVWNFNNYGTKNEGKLLKRTLPNACDSLDLPQKLGTNRGQFQDAADQCLAFHQRRSVGDSLWFHVPTGDPRRLGRRAWRDNNANTAVAASTHGTTPGIDQEGNQKSAKCCPQ